MPNSISKGHMVLYLKCVRGHRGVDTANVQVILHGNNEEVDHLETDLPRKLWKRINLQGKLLDYTCLS